MQTCAPPLRPADPPSLPLAAQQIAELHRVAAKYGFEAVRNDAPLPCTPGIHDGVRSHLGHLRLEGTILDPWHQPAPLLRELNGIDGVPLVVAPMDKFAPLERCILCGGSKGETYMICAGCYTTAARVTERSMLAVRPDLDEKALAGTKPLPHDQFVRAIRSTPRLERRSRARLDPAAEASRRAAYVAVGAASRFSLLKALRTAVAEATSPAERARRTAELQRAVNAAPWSSAEWYREHAKHALDDHWLDVLARGEQEETGRDDEYPVEWLDTEWLPAPDRVASVAELPPGFVARANVAAGGPEHAAALKRNDLVRAWTSASAQARYDPDAGDYAARISRLMEETGGRPSLDQGRAPKPWDGDACDRWDRWVDAILGGDAAADPGVLDPFDAARCRLWGEAVATAPDGTPAPVGLPTLSSGLPSGRLRWPQFVQEEIEAEYQPWGCWAEIENDEGAPGRAWTDPEPAARATRRRLSPGGLRRVAEIRLKAWARTGPSPHAGAAAHVTCPLPKGSRAAWAREIRTERRNRRFMRLAREHADIRRTRIERAQAEND